MAHHVSCIAPRERMHHAETIWCIEMGTQKHTHTQAQLPQRKTLSDEFANNIWMCQQPHVISGNIQIKLSGSRFVLTFKHQVKSNISNNKRRGSRWTPRRTVGGGQTIWSRTGRAQHRPGISKVCVPFHWHPQSRCTASHRRWRDDESLCKFAIGRHSHI